MLNEVDEQASKINHEIERIFQYNQHEIEKETKLIKDKVDGRQLNDLNSEEELKKRSDNLKIKIENKSNEIKNLKINLKIYL